MSIRVSMLRAALFVSCLVSGLLSGCSGAVPASAPDASSPGGDGTPTRWPCQESFGSALGDGFGRLDGIVYAVVLPSHRGCRSDADHVHLQVAASGARYDVAINVSDTNGSQVSYLARTQAAPGPAWNEGWQVGVSLDYAELGLHATDFVATAQPALVDLVAAELASTNHVSVFATAYPDHSGAHLVHRNGTGFDGALVLRPTETAARLLMFRFAAQIF